MLFPPDMSILNTLFQSEIPSKQPEAPDDVIAQKVKH